MVSKPDMAASPTCRTCSTELSDARNGFDLGEAVDELAQLYCVQCQRGVCPHCEETTECSHSVAFSCAGDFASSSLDEWLPRSSATEGHYLAVLGIEEDWHLLDRLIEEAPESVITIQFDAPAHWLAYYYAEN